MYIDTEQQKKRPAYIFLFYLKLKYQKLEYWQSQEGPHRALCKSAGAMFNSHKSRSKFTVKITCLKSMVPLGRYGHKEHICQIWTPSLLQWGYGQGHILKNFGTVWKALSQGTHMPNTKALSLRIRKLRLMIKFSKVGQRSQSRSHVQNSWYCRKGLVIRKRHAKYESAIS